MKKITFIFSMIITMILLPVPADCQYSSESEKLPFYVDPIVVDRLKPAGPDNISFLKKPWNPGVKPAMILAGTFLVNHFIILNNEKKGSFRNTTAKTGTVYAAGFTICTVTFFIGEKKYKQWEKANFSRPGYHK